jgi:hypothetical protein
MGTTIAAPTDSVDPMVFFTPNMSPETSSIPLRESPDVGETTMGLMVDPGQDMYGGAPSNHITNGES